ncbi:glycosyltransferase family 9 protein [Streptomyces somaliensis]|uniref:glycosyltransferase family 9 protein n=1 Tax=Streptomyces somaliensis TaxID=78355 RepID=UPI0034E96756
MLPASALRAVPVRLAWRGPAPEAAVDLHGRAPPSHLLLERTRPGRLLAFAHPGTPAPPGPAVEGGRTRTGALVPAAGVVRHPGPADLRLPPPREPSPAPGAVVVHPGADAAARRWPPERCRAGGAELRRGHRVVLTGGPGDGAPRARGRPAGSSARGRAGGAGCRTGGWPRCALGRPAVVSEDTGTSPWRTERRR